MQIRHNTVEEKSVFLYVKPTWCTIFLSMFISFLCMFRATMCPSSGEITVSMRHLVLVILCEWQTGMQGGRVDDCLVCRVEWKPIVPDSHSDRITSTKCRINKVVSPDDGHIVARNMWRQEINILRKIVHKVGFIYKIIQGCRVNKTKKPSFVYMVSNTVKFQ